MARQRTNKTAAKRFKLSNPRGAKKSKLLRVKSGHHLKTKKRSASDRRRKGKFEVSKTLESNIRQALRS